MNKDVANSLLSLSKSFDDIIVKMFSEVEKIANETAKSRFNNAVADLMGNVARDLIFPIENMYPDLRTDNSEGMWLLRANKIDLITSSTAVEIIRRVVCDRYGQDEVDRNEPLTVKDDGDSWLVRGTMSASAARSGRAWMGPIRGRVAKFDGQILGFIFEGDSEKLFGV